MVVDDLGAGGHMGPRLVGVDEARERGVLETAHDPGVEVGRGVPRTVSAAVQVAVERAIKTLGVGRPEVG